MPVRPGPGGGPGGLRRPGCGATWPGSPFPPLTGPLPLPWERWVEWGSMALAAWLGFRLYVPLYSPLGELFFSLG